MRFYEVIALGYPIRAQVIRLHHGADIGIYGGCRTHVGAVTLAEPDGQMQTLVRPTHRENAVSERCAAALAQAWQVPVCVRCGIHYDGVTPQGLTGILAACDRLLEQMIREEEDDAAPNQG